MSRARGFVCAGLSTLLLRLAIVAAMLGGAGTAAADEAAAFFDVHRDEAAELCPDSTKLWQAIDVLFPHHRIHPAAGRNLAGLNVAIVIRRAPVGYEATLRVVGEQWLERRITDSDLQCGGMSEALAVAVVLLLDPEAERRTDPPPDARDSAPSEGRPPRAIPFLLAAEAGGVAGTAVLGDFGYPSFGPSISVAADFGGPGLRVRGVRLLSPRRDFRSGTVEADLWGVMFGPCWRVPLSAWWLSPCAELGLGTQRGTARGFSTSGSADRPWRVFAAELLAQTRIAGPVWGILSAAATLRLHDQTFLVSDVPALQQSRFGLLFGVGIGSSWEISGAR